MIKKILMVTGAVVLIPAFIFGRDAWSYVRTAGQSVRNAVKSEVPPEFEIKRIKELVDNLIPDIRRCMHVIAEQQVDIENLRDDLDRRQAELAKQEELLLGMTDDLESGQSTFKYASHVYTAEEVRLDLASRFAKFKVSREAADRDRQILKARETALTANQKKLEGMLDSKQTLEVEIAQLEARVKSIQAAESVSELSFDDSQLAQAKQAIRDLNRQMDVRERMMDVEGRFTDLIPLEDLRKVPADLSQQVRSYLNAPAPANEKVAASDAAR